MASTLRNAAHYLSRVLGLGLALASVDAAAAHASPELERGSVEFIWDAPPSCPTEAEVATRVEALLGTSLATASQRRVSVIARVREEDGGWNMRLFTVTPEGTRERSLDHARCDLLAEATAVVVALAIDPTAGGTLPADDDALALVGEPEEAESEQPEDEEDEEEPAPAPDDVMAPMDEKRPPAAPPQRPRPFGILAAGGTVGWGALPKTAGGLAARAGVGWTHLRVEATVHYAFARSVRLDHPETPGADIGMWAVGPRVCGLPWARRIEVPLCAGFEGGQMFARPVRLDDARRVAAPWAAFTLAAGLAWVPIRMFALRLEAEGFVSLRRPAFDVDGAQSLLHRAGPGGIRGLLAAELRFR